MSGTRTPYPGVVALTDILVAFEARLLVAATCSATLALLSLYEEHDLRTLSQVIIVVQFL